MDHRLKRSPGLYLTGFMASGKTTVARALADRIGWEFVDVDAEIQPRATDADFLGAGRTRVPPHRNGNVDPVVARVASGKPSVIALGGGAFTQPANMTCWWTTAFPYGSTVPSRRSTPVSTTPSVPCGPWLAIRKPSAWPHEERRAFYERAHFRIDADCEPDQAVERILALPFWK